MSAKKTQSQKIMTSYFIVAVVVILFGVLIYGKAIQTSWKDGEAWREQGALQVRDSVEIKPERGDIRL